jgi:hypothetical protein
MQQIDGDVMMIGAMRKRMVRMFDQQHGASSATNRFDQRCAERPGSC